MAGLEDEFNKAKAYLMQSSSKSGTSLYDHLASVLTKIIDERPSDPVTSFESVSQEVKSDNVTTGTTITEKKALPTEFPTADKRNKLFQLENFNYDDAIQDDGSFEAPVPDILTRCQLFEDGGVGLGREETFRIFLSIKELADSQSEKGFCVRPFDFWGKIFGTEKDYYVCECEYNEDPDQEEEEQSEETEENVQATEDEEGIAPPPKSAFIAPKPLKTENAKEGVNKKCYFVCNEPGGEWVRLPKAKPGTIVAARQMRRLFTGNLDTKMAGWSTDLSAEKDRSSYPPFEGTEKDYLRAQIARITADTHLCPSELYQLEEEEEPEEEDGVPPLRTYAPTEEYTGWTSRDALLSDPNLAQWVHYEHDILPQGTALWQNPNPPKPENDDEEEEEEEEEEKPDPETGRVLLEPALVDAKVDDANPWSCKLTSLLNPAFSAVMASSNLWPGAHSVVYENGKSYANIYIGDGQIYSSQTFNPPLPPMSAIEYEVDETVTEQIDPTVEQEDEEKARLEAEQEEEEDNEDD